MVDAARQMLDELMGRNRNLGPTEKGRKVNWDDPDFCQYFLVKFCPHDLFVNTRADLGPCPRLHDEEAKKMYENARPGARKRQFEDDFLRFCNNMLNEVDRKIQKGRQRLLLMNKTENGMPAAPVYISKYQEQLNNLNARIKKLLSEAEEAGHRGDVDQAQDLMTLCEQLKDEKEALIAQHDQNNVNPVIAKTAENGEDGTSVSQPPTTEKKLPPWMLDLNGIPEKQMEVCEVCGAFLIVGDAQQRIEDHLMGKQHLGYSKLRNAVEEMHEKRQKEREEEEKRREEERKVRGDADFNRDRRGGGDRRRDFRDRRGYSRERGGGHRDRYPDRRRDDRYSSKSHRRSRSRSPSRHSHSHSHSHSNSHSRTSRSRSRSHSSRK